MNDLRQTPLNPVHQRAGGKLVDFAGWEMPIEYPTGIKTEHLAVRNAAGLFDVSHMGELEIKGDDALNFLQRLTPNDVTRLADYQVHYSALLTPAGTFVDDILVYRFRHDHFLLCVNAANTKKDYEWALAHKSGRVSVSNVSQEYAQLAIQGPKAMLVVQKLTTVSLPAIKNYWFTTGMVSGAECIISRTGYTGEDGFELYVAPDRACELWNRLLEAGEEFGLIPVGLGARNTLRLEAKMALYGHDIDETTTAYEADLGWIVKLEKGDFIGRPLLEKQKGEGLARKLVGFEMVGRGIARDNYPIRINGAQVSRVTSGSPAPFLKKNVGLAYLPMEHSYIGANFDVMVREAPVKAVVVPTPFFKRAR
ncbi:MAG: glycine cleavage system aminomethyltransferase GcvT [Acidobacteria bacterium]|nr:glycine cleavage system aminomethyltransferase GcvT [Acidobacteriota bacterium]MBI3658381.1 glycine cleavage system aminomethyltransferase GcvT [Acidobacteriota bacterium]